MRLGAHWNGKETEFSVFSINAEKVELCLFAEGSTVEASQEGESLFLQNDGSGMWSISTPRAAPGTAYAYRVHGEYDPKKGHLFNESKLLLDPYARLIAREPQWDCSLFAYDNCGGEDDDLLKSEIDSISHSAIGRVSEPLTVERVSGPSIPWKDTVFYEAHVKGATQLHPEVPEELRGTYAGLASEAFVTHLLRLGVTAIDLLPVHCCFDEAHLFERGLTNYWGYNTLSYFSLSSRYASAASKEDPRAEFLEMVNTFHRAGIEVIIDVVYNHTCEGNHKGPTLSFRGFDNSEYYRLSHASPRYYSDYTGCGNTLNSNKPHVRNLVIDSLSYFVEEFGVDGFRFDLAPVLGREEPWFNSQAAFFKEVAADPRLKGVKLIAEPWDVGEGGYQLGGFPQGWAEWNGEFRDRVRSFWVATPRSIGALADHLTGSSSIFQVSNRPPQAGINFVTCHDGFTLRDLVSYNSKHNEANLEENRDGSDNNRSWNCGHEGDSDDPEILALRVRQQKNLLATNLLSIGVPMLLGGDELNRTQGGNNNAYCQDSKISWLDWERTEESLALSSLVRWLLSFRKTHPVFSRSEYLKGERNPHTKERDVSWWSVSGEEMTPELWAAPDNHCLGVLFGRDASNDADAAAHLASLSIWFNASMEAVHFSLPKAYRSKIWNVVLDTADPETPETSLRLSNCAKILAPKSLVLLEAEELF